MSVHPVPYSAPLGTYDELARVLLGEFEAGDHEAVSRFKWEHPRFRGRPLSDLLGAKFDLDDARTVVAREHSFENWADLGTYTVAVERDDRVRRFEAAVESVIAGDAAALRSMLRDRPDLVHARSTRRHHATLLHYLGANGVEGQRQMTPANVVEILEILLDAGAEPDALADMYDNKCTTLSLLVSSEHPAAAGLQAALAEKLLDRGAALDGPGSNWKSAVMTALMFGYLDTARRLAERGGAVDDLAVAAGLGRVHEARGLLLRAERATRHAALALSAQHGHVAIVRMLLDAGEDPNRYNPDGFHSHSTPLHQAIAADHPDVVRLLVERGARLDVEDTIYHGTALGWAVHCERPAIADYLRKRGAPDA